MSESIDPGVGGAAGAGGGGSERLHTQDASPECNCLLFRLAGKTATLKRMKGATWRGGGKEVKEVEEETEEEGGGCSKMDLCL